MNDPKLLNDETVREFIANGFIKLTPDVDPAAHAEIDALIRYSFEHESRLGNNVVSRIPRIHDVLRCHVVDGALRSIAGDNYYFHPHRAIHRSTPVEDKTVALRPDINGPRMGKGSSSGSGWHADAQSPLSRARHHTPRFLIGFYFPHDTPLAMGPTRMQAGSYLYSNPVEPHAVVLPDFVEAGTFLLVHFDMVHAGYPNLGDIDRMMVKFVFTRTRFPTAPTWRNEALDWSRPSGCLPEFDIPDAWSWIWSWMRGAPKFSAGNGAAAALWGKDQVARLNAIYQSDVRLDDLVRHAGRSKHKRKLANVDYPRDDVDGYPRVWNERAVVMEDETYTLVARGKVAELTSLLAHDDPWMQINAAFGVGELGAEVVDGIAPLLASPHQQVVRQSLDAIGCIGRGIGPALDGIESLLTRSNPAWQEPQVGRGWHGEDQVRLNAVFALLSAVNDPEDIDRIETILEASLNDPCGYVGAVASEALVRIGSKRSMATAVRYLSDRRWDESLRHMKPY
ncbi:MAG: hypothetical protein CMQ29_11085 [Gammaproteobacteria bacterium]|nr:hypothetical protein [Gammaproteobacteria bacterium]